MYIVHWAIVSSHYFHIACDNPAINFTILEIPYGHKSLCWCELNCNGHGQSWNLTLAQISLLRDLKCAGPWLVPCAHILVEKLPNFTVFNCSTEDFNNEICHIQVLSTCNTVLTMKVVKRELYCILLEILVMQNIWLWSNPMHFLVDFDNSKHCTDDDES